MSNEPMTTDPLGDGIVPASGFSTNEIVGMRAAWIEAGHSEDAFDAMTKADGITLPTPVPEGQAEWDRDHGINSNQSADDYYIEWSRPGDMKDILSTTREVTEAFASIKLPRHLGPPLADRIRDLGLQWQQLDQEQKHVWVQQQKDTGAHSAGKEAVTTIERDARELLRSSGNAFLNLLEAHPIANDIWMLRTLALHARALREWKAGRPGGAP